MKGFRAKVGDAEFWYRQEALVRGAATAMPGAILERVTFTAKLTEKERVFHLLNGNIEALGPKYAPLDGEDDG